VTTITSRVNVSAGDAMEKRSDTTMSLTDIQLQFGDKNALRDIGLHFSQNISGLAGVTIDDADVTMLPDVTDGGGFTGLWYGEDAESPAVFTSTNADISNRSLVGTTLAGDGSDFTSWTDEVSEVFSGFGPILQDVIDQGHDPTAIVLIHKCTVGTGERIAHSYDGEDFSAPLLTVNFTAASTAKRRRVGYSFGRGRRY